MAAAQKSLAAIFGITDGPVELIEASADRETHMVRIEYLGPNGIEVQLYAPAEACRVAVELLEWADRQAHGN